MAALASAAALLLSGSIQEVQSSPLRLALTDPIGCSVGRDPRLPGVRTQLDGFAHVSAMLPAGFVFAGAHDCIVEGRPVVHATFQGAESAISVIVVSQRETEHLSAGLRRAHVMAYRIDAFETPRHYILVVTSLDRQTHDRVAAAIAEGARNIVSAAGH
jgi:hypothetical protein